jgi:hypothetical protein
MGELWQPLMRDCIMLPRDAAFTSLTFFTVWVLLLHLLLYPLPWLHGVSVVLAIVVSAAGSYLTYVYPQHISVCIGPNQYTITGPALWFVDLLAHQLPLWVLLRLYGTNRARRPDACLTALVVVYTYLLCVNAKEKYGITDEDVCFLLCVVVTAFQCHLRQSC